MEYLGLCLSVICGVAVAFFCMYFYQKGIEVGRAVKEEKPVRKPTTKKPKVEKKKEEEKPRSNASKFLSANGE